MKANDRTYNVATGGLDDVNFDADYDRRIQGIENVMSMISALNDTVLNTETTEQVRALNITIGNNGVMIRSTVRKSRWISNRPVSLGR